MSEIFFDLTKPGYKMNYRWVQPPQIAYFVTTIDSAGNVNSTPVTLGTCVSVDMELESCGNMYFTFALGCTDLPHVPARQACQNLSEVPQCVISYIGSHLFRESQVACLPLPKGVSEIDVAGLTELPSHHVRPPGIVEAGVNLEAEVVSTCPIGDYYRLYVCKLAGVSVDEKLVAQDNQSELHAGILALDPLFELTVFPLPGRPPRLYYIQLDKSSVRRMPDDFGPSRTWVGKFEDWIDDELARGRLKTEERERILALHREWEANPDPDTNREGKALLTKALKDLVAPLHEKR